MLEMSHSATHVYDQEQEIYIAVKHKNPRHERDVTVSTHVYDQEQEIYIAVKHKNPRHVRDVTVSHTCL